MSIILQNSQNSGSLCNHEWQAYFFTLTTCLSFFLFRHISSSFWLHPYLTVVISYTDLYTIYHFSLHHGNNEAVLLSGSHSYSPCLSGTHSLLMFCDLSVNCLINVSCDLPISFKDIYINTSLYIFPVVLWCFVIMFYLWPFRGQTMEFVTNCLVLLILYVDIINNYNKTTVHNVVLSFWYSFNFGHFWHWQGPGVIFMTTQHWQT